MTGFTPELVTKAARAIVSAVDEDGEPICWAPTFLNKYEAAQWMASAALEASGIAELTEALRDAVDALKVARAVVAHHNPQGSANLDAIDRVLAKIGGNPSDHHPTTERE